MRSADKSTGERGLDRKRLQNLDRDDKKDSLARNALPNPDKAIRKQDLARKRERKLDKDSEKDRLDRITLHNLDKGSCQQSITRISSLNWRRLSEQKHKQNSGFKIIKT